MKVDTHWSLFTPKKVHARGKDADLEKNDIDVRIKQTQTHDFTMRSSVGPISNTIHINIYIQMYIFKTLNQVKLNFIVIVAIEPGLNHMQ